MDLMEKIVSLAKRRGFIFSGSEIYGGIGGFYDYGPLGVALKNNIKRVWWKAMVYDRDDVVGLDSAIITHPKVWEASGHIESFTDPLVECKKCHKRFRADHMAEQKQEHCPECGGEFTKPKKFNLLMETYLGTTEEARAKTYLRGETCQGIYLNFKNVLNSTALKIPFGIAQIGKAFRNEISPGNFTYRTREFEQMEMQYFVAPSKKEAKKWFDYWRQLRMKWYLDLGIKRVNLRFRKHAADERAHYAREAVDIEYKAPFGWSEFEGIHNRGDWDLSRHSQYSGRDLSYFNEETQKRFIPWIVETSAGADRATLFFLIDAFVLEAERIVLKLHPQLAPIKAAVFPLLANKLALVKKAKSVYDSLRKKFIVAWDDRGNIGKRYFSQDEIGTPWCVTIDHQTLKDNTVTVRFRDTKKQVRKKVGELEEYFREELEQ